MFRSLIVPLDGSPFAEHALPYAASIARRAGARLQVVLVHTPVISNFGGGEVVPDPILDTEIREKEAAYLNDLIKRLNDAVSLQVSHTILDGVAAETIQDFAVASAADLVVMATHGRGGFSRFWLGSVADKMVRQLPMPILLVRPQAEAPDLAQDHVLHRILVPLDGSHLAEQALGPAIDVGALMQAEYLLLRVVDPIQLAGLDSAGFPISGLAPEGRQHLQDEAINYLDRTADSLRGRSLPVLTSVDVSPQIADAILHAAVASSTDLIALATHGRGGLSRMYLGSIADKVIRGAVTPVLVHRPLVK